MTQKAPQTHGSTCWLRPFCSPRGRRPLPPQTERAQTIAQHPLVRRGRASLIRVLSSARSLAPPTDCTSLRCHFIGDDQRETLVQQTAPPLLLSLGCTKSKLERRVIDTVSNKAEHHNFQGIRGLLQAAPNKSGCWACVVKRSGAWMTITWPPPTGTGRGNDEFTRRRVVAAPTH